MKSCRICGEVKPLSCFSPSKSGGLLGVQPYCKPCRAARYSRHKAGREESESAWALPQHDYTVADHALRNWPVVERVNLMGLTEGWK